MREPFEPIDYEKFAKRLRDLRDLSGIEDTDIAEKLNISAQAVGKWMNARNLPDSQHICDLSDLFGVSTDYLLKGTHDDNRRKAEVNEDDSNSADIKTSYIFGDASIEVDRFDETSRYDMQKRLKLYAAKAIELFAA